MGLSVGDRVGLFVGGLVALQMGLPRSWQVSPLAVTVEHNSSRRKMQLGKLAGQYAPSQQLHSPSHEAVQQELIPLHSTALAENVVEHDPKPSHLTVLLVILPEHARADAQMTVESSMVELVHSLSLQSNAQLRIPVPPHEVSEQETTS